jgi:hypothetical protein
VVSAPAVVQGAATEAITEPAAHVAAPATVDRPAQDRVLAALRACYRSPARDRGKDVEVAFELVDSRIATRVGTRGLDRLPACARRAAALLENRAVVVTITFRPS